MAGAGDIRAGGAYVEVYTRDSVDAGLSKAQGRMIQVGREADALAGRVTGMGASFTGAFKAATWVGIVLMAVDAFRRVADEAANARKEASQLGMSYGQFQGLQKAASSVGLGAEEAASGIRNMLQSTADAAEGSKEKLAAFKKLGLDPAALLEKGSYEEFLAISQAMSQMQSPAERLAVTMDIFGRNALNVSAILAKGREAIDGYSRQMTVMSDTDAMALSKVIGGFGKIASGSWAGVKWLAAQPTKLGYDVKWAVTGHDELAEALQREEQARRAANRGAVEHAENLRKAAEQAKAAAEYSKTAEQNNQRVASIYDALTQRERTALGHDPLEDRIKDMYASAAPMSQIRELEAELARVRRIEAERNAVKEASEADRMGRQIEGETPAGRFANRMDSLRDAFQSGMVSQEAYAGAVERAKTEYRRAVLGQTPLDDFKNKLDDLRKARANRTITDDEFDKATKAARRDAIRGILSDGETFSSSGQFGGAALSMQASTRAPAETTAKNTGKLIQQMDEMIKVARDNVQKFTGE